MYIIGSIPLDNVVNTLVNSPYIELSRIQRLLPESDQQWRTSLALCVHCWLSCSSSALRVHHWLSCSLLALVFIVGSSCSLLALRVHRWLFVFIVVDAVACCSSSLALHRRSS